MSDAPDTGTDLSGCLANLKADKQFAKCTFIFLLLDPDC
jgi:hypothetical protein